MKRVLCFLFLVFSGGIICGIAVKPNPMPVVLMILALFLMCISRYRIGRTIFCHIYLLIFCLGVFKSSYKIDKLESIYKKLEGKSGVVFGQIVENIVTNGNVTVFSVYVYKISIDNEEYYTDYKVKVVDYRNDKNYIIPFNAVEIEGEFKSYAGYRNTKMHNYDLQLMKDGICGTFVPYYNSKIASYRCSDRYFRQLIYGLKSKVLQNLNGFVDKKSFILLKGILFGDLSEINEDDYNKFQDSGIVHIFAVSGYNIWLIYRLLLTMLFFIKNYKRTSTAIIILLLWVYTVMSGLTSSVVRAFVMIAIVLVGKTLKRQSDPLTSLCFAGLLILIINPLEIINIGFQLSFAATLSIILLLPILQKITLPLPIIIKDMLLTIFAVQIGIVPIIMYYFNEFQMLSIVSNIIVVPLVSAMTVLGLLLCLASFVSESGALVIGKIIGYITSTVLQVTNYISSIQYSSVDVVSPNIFHLFAYYLFIGFVFGFIRIKGINIKKTYYYFALVFAVICIITNLPSSELRISFIDVGQGDCIFITTPDRKHILIDGGGKSKNSYSSLDIGEDVLKPYLYKHGVNKLDVIIATHFHDDHFNGLIPVLKRLNTGSFVIRGGNGTSELLNNIDDIVIDNDIISSVACGDVINVGKHIKLYILNPKGDEKDENDSSIVIKLVYKEFSALFTGDISSDVENRLLEYNIEADILKVPHHGSESSLSSAFLEKVNPEAAVICVGDNSFGHPSKKALDSLEEKKVMVFRTDINGEIIITTRGKGFKIRTVM